MRYRNKITGAVIETASVVSGEPWIEEPEKTEEQKPKSRKARKKEDAT